MALRFRIDGEPISWKRPVWIHGHYYSPNIPRQTAIRDQLRRQFEGPLIHGLLRVEITFYFKRPQHHFIGGFVRRVDAPHWLDRRVDLDNLSKLIFDALSGTIYIDDRQIGHLTTSKCYSDRTNGYTEITISALN